MKILVLNGSPKGDKSITLQTVLYLKEKNRNEEFEILPVAAKSAFYENHMELLEEKIAGADLILFSYPVYTFLVPSQLHRIVERMKERKTDLSGKTVTQITTSKHFYDFTAHRFIEENMADLGAAVIRGLSADMEDLTTKKGRQEARLFFDYVRFCMEKGIDEKKRMPESPYEPGMASLTGVEKTEKDSSKQVVIVADLKEGDKELREMIRRFRMVFPYETRVLNLNKVPMKGGCMGCLNCAATGICIHTDHFAELLRKEIQTKDAIVYAFKIKDHSMGSLMKRYDDRQFCNGHRTVTMGQPVAYLVSGPYEQEENLRTVVEARAQTGGNFLAGVATDEGDVNTSVDATAQRLAFALEKGYAPPSNFYGVGGIRIFRDLIYLMQGLMRLDHAFFKENGFYDFPQKRKGTIAAMYLAGELFANPKLKKKLGSKIEEGMLRPYAAVLEEAKRETDENK